MQSVVAKSSRLSNPMRKFSTVASIFCPSCVKETHMESGLDLSENVIYQV